MFATWASGRLRIPRFSRRLAPRMSWFSPRTKISSISSAGSARLHRSSGYGVATCPAHASGQSSPERSGRHSNSFAKASPSWRSLCPKANPAAEPRHPATGAGRRPAADTLCEGSCRSLREGQAPMTGVVTNGARANSPAGPTEGIEPTPKLGAAHAERSAVRSGGHD
jgi:hypothetical protein